jgi:hypothetical protein
VEVMGEFLVVLWARACEAYFAAFMSLCIAQSSFLASVLQIQQTF